MSGDSPPETIFYSETGGKSAPFYRSLAGIKSAFKTVWHARNAYWPRGKPRIYRGTIRWEEINLEGLPIINVQEHPGDQPWGPSLEVHLVQGLDYRGHGLSPVYLESQDLNEAHAWSHREHRPVLTHAHREED